MSKTKTVVGLSTLAAIVAGTTAVIKLKREQTKKNEFLQERLNDNALALRDNVQIDAHVHGGKIHLYKSIMVETDGESSFTPVTMSVDDIDVGPNKVMLVKTKSKWKALDTNTMQIIEENVEDWFWTMEEFNGENVYFLYIYRGEYESCLIVKDNGAVKSRHEASFFHEKKKQKRQ